MQYWIGTSHPNWLWDYNLNLMVSARSLEKYKSFHRANQPWFRDGGGFTELQIHGSWINVPIKMFVEKAQLHYDEIGNIAHMAPQDWMCEPIIMNGGRVGKLVFAGTKLSIYQHQINTVVNFIELNMMKPDLPWIPVLQGWELDDYLVCEQMYYDFGIDLKSYDLVGVGTVCRRQGTIEAANILRRLKADGLKLHAFGLKGTGIPNVAPFLDSSDSMAWSYDAYRNPPLPECEAEARMTGKGHRHCTNCHLYATKWFNNIQKLINEHKGKHYQTAMEL